MPQFDTPNHQYDMTDFDSLVAAIHHGILPPSALPAVSFLKAPGFQDGHAAYSDPLDEQQFIVNEINALEKTPDWASTAVVISYDDSDGWYDHVYPGVANPSTSVADALTGTGACGTGTPLAGEQGRCGYGPRLPLLVISPWAAADAVDHTRTDQSSILRFVEDNWRLSRISGSFDAIAGSLQGPVRLRRPPVRAAAPQPLPVPQPDHWPADRLRPLTSVVSRRRIRRTHRFRPPGTPRTQGAARPPIDGSALAEVDPESALGGARDRRFEDLDLDRPAQNLAPVGADERPRALAVRRGYLDVGRQAAHQTAVAAHRDG